MRTTRISLEDHARMTCIVAGLCLAGSLAMADYPTAVSSLNPVAYYRLNETGPSPYSDFATNLGSAGFEATALFLNYPGHGGTGALPGDPTSFSTSFDGISQLCLLGPSAGWASSGAFSAEVWAQPSGTGKGLVMGFAQNLTARSGWSLYRGVNSSNWTFQMYNHSGTVGLNISGGPVISPGTWYYLAVVYDGANGYLYVNGLLAASNTLTGYTPWANDGGGFSVGGEVDLANYFYGNEEEAAYYHSALSAAQILAHYENGISASPNPSYRSLVASDNPVLYYRLNEPGFDTLQESGQTLPVAANLGSLGVNANGIYTPDTLLGASGPPLGGSTAGNYAVLCPGLCYSYPHKVVGFIDCGNAGVSMNGTYALNPAPGPFVNPGPTSSLTVIAWFQVNTWDRISGTYWYNYIAGKGDSPGWRLTRDGTSHQLTFDSENTNTVFYRDLETSAIVNLCDQAWHHVAIVYSHTNSAKYVYLDGAPVATNIGENSLAQNNDDFAIGTNPDVWGRVWNGKLAEVAVWYTNLTTLQISNLFQAATPPPQITSLTISPSRTVYAGQTATFSASAFGPGPLRYQWMDGTNVLSGKTNNSLALGNVQTNNSGQYAVIVTGAYASITSAIVPLTVIAGPILFLQQPVSYTLYPGATADLSVGVVGALPIAYQWYWGTSPIANATNSSLVVSPVAATNAGSYYAKVSNSFGSTNSATAVLTVLAAPSANYSRVLMAYGPANYWPMQETSGTQVFDYAGGVTGSVVGDVSLGASGPQPSLFNGFTLSNDSLAIAGDPGPTAYVDVGQVNLNLNSFAITAWIIDNNPSGVYWPGLVAKGTSSWRFQTDRPFNGSLIGPLGLDTTGTALDVVWTHDTNIWDGNWHHVVAQFDAATHTKYIYVDGQIEGSIYTGGQVSVDGDDVTIGGNDQNNGNQNGWLGNIDHVALFNRILSPGEVANLYLAGVDSSMPVGVPIQPVAQQIIVGHPVTFDVGVTGPLPITYQWRKGGVPIPGATDENLIIPGVSAGDQGSYDVVAATGGGATNSQPAVLTVMAAPVPGSLTYGLVLHLQFDSNYLDSSGRGTPVVTNGSPVFVPGHVGSAAVQVSNDGMTNFNSIEASLLDTLAFGASDNFSVSLWVNFTGNYNDLPFIGNARSSTYQPGWVITSDGSGGQLDYTLVQAGGGPSIIEDTVPNSPSLNDGQWHHVVLTIDRVNAAAVSYADGAAFNTNSLTNVSGVSFATGYAVAMGADPTSWYPVPGTYNIDDVGIWNRVLSGPEVGTIYTMGQSGQTYSLSPAGVSLTIQLTSPGAVRINWSSGTLQSAPALTGPWNAVPGAAPPSYEATPTATTFYRIKF